MQPAQIPNTPPPGTPSHLVISLDDDAPIAKTIEGLFESNPTATRAAARSMQAESAEVFRGKSESHSEVRLYPQFNVATLDLTAAQVASLRSPRVLVVPNEQRHILGWPADTSDPAEPFIARSTLVPPSAGQPTPDDPFDSGHPDEDPLEPSREASLRDYIQGQKDALDSVLRRLERTSLPDGFEPAMEADASTDLEWHLQAVGIRSGQNFLGNGVKVAVLDTGLDLAHPDFAGRVAAANCRSFVPGAATVNDGNGHGTHCCGLVNGPVSPFSGRRYGAAPGAELLVGKVLDDGGSGYDSGIIAGIAWAAGAGARVISLSLGSARRVGAASAAAYEHIARRLARAGLDCLLVAAAGNESRRSVRRLAPVGNPAACPSFLAVAAVDRSRRVADFSCAQLDRIGTLELSAPGVAVRSSIPTALVGTGADPYAAFSGTSMATPIAAGVAALWRQAFPALTSVELWRELVRRARPLGTRRDYGFGMVQVP